MQSTNELNGILLINKKNGKTSFQTISAIKKILKIKKIGHAGTLDKNAEGLLITGKATKLLKFFINKSKKYTAEIHFGKQTNTDDSEGIIINSYEGIIQKDKIINSLKDFSGIIKQIPPDFSAVHINGKRAYKIALKNKKPVIKERYIEIINKKIISFKPPVLKLEIECSSGTYIRSIARDLGLKTGYYAYLSSLKRESIGKFNIANAYTVEDMENINHKILPPYEALYDMSSIEIFDHFINQIKNGENIKNNWFKDIDINSLKSDYFKIHSNNNLLAIVKFNNGNFLYDLVY